MVKTLLERCESGLIGRLAKPLYGSNRTVGSNPTLSAFALKLQLMWQVYILQCSDKKPYTGCTDDLKDRLARHQRGNVPATAKRLPVKLVCYTSFPNKYKAFAFEKYLKTGSGRSFMRRHLV